MSRIRVLIVDDHVLVCQALAELLRLQKDMLVVGQAHDRSQAMELVCSLKPDIVLMDIEMSGERDAGVEATRWIAAQCPQSRVVMLTIHTEEEFLFEAIKAGARGYVLKNTGADELLETIRAAHRGEARLNSAMALKMLEEFRRLSAVRSRPEAEYIHLTDRERDILDLVAQGASNTEIAQHLGISEKTVSNRLSIIFDKLHINNRTQAALFALREGLSRHDSDRKKAL